MKITSLFGNGGYQVESSYITFKARTSAGSIIEQEDVVPLIDVPASEVSYVTSFISLEHPTGKWWESLFIPMTKAGTLGVSITTWGRAAGAAGSIQVKMVTEGDWYGTAHSKFGAGGYGVLTYAGRESGLSSLQTNTIRNMKPSARSAPIGVLREHESKIIESNGPAGVVKALAEQLNLVTPIEWFLTKAYLNNKHPFNEIEKLYENVSPQNKPLLEALITGFDAMGLEAANADQIRKVVKPVEPQIDRTEVYGQTWGVFG